MQRILLKSKIHRATVTDSNLQYERSLTIDEELLRSADILQYEQIKIYNVSNGESRPRTPTCAAHLRRAPSPRWAAPAAPSPTGARPSPARARPARARRTSLASRACAAASRTLAEVAPVHSPIAAAAPCSAEASVLNDKILAAGVVALLGAGIALGACGSDSEATGDDGGVEAGSGFANDGGGGGGGGDAFIGCAKTTKKAEKLPVDMVLGLDTSFSMDFDSKWTNVRDALKAFVSNPAYADLGIALQFFPIRKQCSVPDYATPAVPLSLQPAAQAPISAALDNQQMSGGTPMVPLLEGLAKYLKANPNPARKQVIVLATDGFPDDTCIAGTATSKANTIENAVLVADQAFKATPSIPTFVIGVGSELAALNAIGQAGGTGNAILVDTSANAQAAFLTALDTIRRAAIPCDFPLPEFGAFDAANTNVTYTPASGISQPYAFVGNEAGCAKAPTDGWYFDSETTPTKIILCKGACDVVKADDSGTVDVVYGCPRIVR